MAVQYKFRSSVAFDSVDLSGRSSISVRDLRARISDIKKLKICADFDLVLSDADTGKVFENEDFQIPVGASVVIKRVPTGREATNDRDAIAGTAGKSGGCVGTLQLSTSENFGVDNFDDFGFDLYPNLDTTIHCYADDMDHFNSSANKKKDVSVRSFEVPNLKGQKIDRSDVSEDLSNIGENFREESDEGENQKEMNSKNNVELKKKLSEDMHFQVTFNTDLPAELRCSLCNSIFKEAVMIPCCQHSFCNRCIASTLVKQSSCPKCSSTKCTVKDLLPNLSLRQAIEHFLEAQNASIVSYNNLPMYAPDGESGIQTKEVSCAVSVRPQLPTCQPSPSATGMGSNHVVSEPASECNFPFKRNEELCTETRGGRVAIPSIKHRKYERNCYMCGAPDHLIRECPHAKTGNAVASGGIPPYQEGYWRGASFTNVRPYANIYGAPPMMPFDPMMFQAPAFGISSCMPPMYGSLPAPYGFMTMGAVPHLMMPGVEPITHAAETMNKKNGVRKRNYELQERYHGSDLSEGCYSGGTERSHAQLIQSDKRSSSDDDEQRAHGKHSQQKHNSPRRRPSYEGDKLHLVNEKHKEPHLFACGMDQRSYFSEKSKSDLQDVSNDSRRHNGERRSHQHKCSKHSGSDCSWKKHHSSRLHEDDEFVTHLKSHRCEQYNQSESCLEPESSTDHRKLHKERESSHRFRHSSRIIKSRDERLDNDRREMGKVWKKRERDHGYKESRDHGYKESRRIR
ncbi:E3 ubiquitin ligase PQT3-like isoform X2 [Dendrobium catenatum]|uniref:E3 ubiquitin ligase PQT3-like isoform X2 n=1 Tax=Dendrobium catenatum TaxID=906689 RepID=UPI00109FF803|nr:E3 ubiquitin ligase PQT3-like isoform X2 [Dendrobium catenatum]